MYTTSCKWSGIQTITNLVDLGKKRLKIELLDPQNLSSKFIFPRGFSARHLDYLGNCGVRTNVGVGLLHMYRCHRCTAKNSSFIVMRAFRFVGQHYCGLVFMLASSAAAVLPCASRLDSRPRNKRLRKQYGSCGRPRNNERGYFLVALPRLPAIWSINLTSYCRLFTAGGGVVELLLLLKNTVEYSHRSYNNTAIPFNKDGLPLSRLYRPNPFIQGRI